MSNEQNDQQHTPETPKTEACHDTAVTPESPQQQNSEQQLLLAYVGKNNEFYEKKWNKSSRPQTAWSWNWPAFFFGPIWFAYRKMYLFSFLYFVLIFLVDWLIGYDSFITLGIDIALMLTLGGFGNAIYYSHAKRALKKQSKPDLSDEDLQAALSAKGGISIFGIVLGHVFLIVYVTLPFFLPIGTGYAEIIFGTSEDGYELTEITNEFAEGDEIYFDVYFGKPLKTSTIDLYVTKVDGNIEEIIEILEMDVVPNWDGFFTFLDEEEDGMSSYEAGDYVLSIAKNDEIILEGEFTIH